MYKCFFYLGLFFYSLCFSTSKVSACELCDKIVDILENEIQISLHQLYQGNQEDSKLLIIDRLDTLFRIKNNIIQLE